MKQLLNRAELFDFDNATFYSLIESNNDEIVLLNYKTHKKEIISKDRFNKLRLVPKKYSILKALFLGEKGNYKYLYKDKKYVFPTIDEYGLNKFKFEDKYSYTILDYLSLISYFLKIDKASRRERKYLKNTIKSIKKDKFPYEWTFDLNHTISWILSDGLEEYLKVADKNIEISKEDKAKILKIIKTFKEKRIDEKDLKIAFNLLAEVFNGLWW